MTAAFIVSVAVLLISKWVLALFVSQLLAWPLSLVVAIFVHKYLDQGDLSSGDRRRRIIIPAEPRLEISSKRARHLVEYIVNSRGMLLHTQAWLPRSDSEGEVSPKAIIFFCHGYGDDTNWLVKNVAREFVQAGYAFFTMDFEGHGKSDGLWGYVPNFGTLVKDYHDFAVRVKARYPQIPCIVLGESMGGAVALRLGLEHPELCVGTVLSAPMCKIADEMKPPQIVTDVLRRVARILPTLPVAPVPNVAEGCFSLPEILELAKQSPLMYTPKPRLGTALSMLDTSLHLEANLDKVSFPFLVMHGQNDKVTDPSVSMALLAQSQTPDEDKRLNLYADCKHALFHEAPERKERILKEIFGWIEDRIARSESMN